MRKQLGLAILAVLVIIIATTVILSGRELGLPFETIDREDDGIRPGVGPYTGYVGREPQLVIITRAEEITALENVLTPDAWAQLRDLDFRQYFAVAVFQGLKSSNMYGADIQRVTRSDDTVTIYAHFTQRDPEHQAAGMSTSPFHVVMVQKTGLQGEFKFVLNADGAVLSQQTHFLP